MNNGFDCFNLSSERTTQKNLINNYLRTDHNTNALSVSINNKRSKSHKNAFNNEIISDAYNFNFISPYEQKKNEILDYYQSNSKKKNKNNSIKLNYSSSNFNTIQDNIELKQRDLLIDKLNREIYKKNHQIYKQNSLITNLKNKIQVNRNNEKINISNNIYPNNKVNQINNTIYNLKKNSINKELTSRLKENENFYKKIMNENLDSFNYKLIELENKNIILIKKNQLLKNELLELKKKYEEKISKKYLSIKPTHEINLYLIKNKNYTNIIKTKDENILKIQKIISQLKAKNFNLNNELNKLKKDIQVKSNQFINVKNQLNNQQNKLNEILNDNKKKEKAILMKEKEIENKRNEINSLNNKLNNLLNSFEKEKKEKEEIQKLYENNNKEMESNKDEIEKIKAKPFSKDMHLNNITSLSHKIIFIKNIPKYKLRWFLITIKNENEIKDYLNTFWVSEEEMHQIKEKISIDNSNENLDKDKNIENNRIIEKLNNIIIEKEKIINNLKNKINENEILKENGLDINSLVINDENSKDKKGFVSIDKYIKIVNQLSEAKTKINELISEKNNKNKEMKNINESGISEEFSNFLKNVDDENNLKLLEENRNNKINLNNSNDTNKYLEKYIDDLENKLEKIKNLIKILIQEMQYTSNINNTLYNIMIVSGYDDQQAISIIHDKQRSINKTKK